MQFPYALATLLLLRDLSAAELTQTIQAQWASVSTAPPFASSAESVDEIGPPTQKIQRSLLVCSVNKTLLDYILSSVITMLVDTI